MGRAILLLIAVVLEDRVTDGNALIVDVGAWVIRGGGDQFTNNILAFMTERTSEGIVGAGTLHGISCTKGIEVSYAPSIPDFPGRACPTPTIPFLQRTINTMAGWRNSYLALALVVAGTAAAVTPPKQALGFNLGDDYQVANYTQLEKYWKKLAAESDRMKLVDIGATAEGRRQYMAIVSSPAKQKPLSRWLFAMARLKPYMQASSAPRVAGRQNIHASPTPKWRRS